MTHESSATAVFDGWNQRRARGEAPPFDALLLDHPALADDLRILERHARLLEDLLPGTRARIVLEGEPQPQRRNPLLQRLQRHQRLDSPHAEKGLLGEGGMGRVLEVYDEDLRRSVAMKVLKDGRRDGELAELRARFLEEAQVTAQLDHPGVPPIHELGLLPDGRVFYTMPKLRGTHLADVFAKHRAGDPAWPLVRCVGLVLRVCETLAFAHSRGVVHRDVKPANVMVGAYGEVMVIDWGLARVRGATVDRVWSDRLLELQRDFGESLYTTPKGSPGFMAPELAGFDAELQDERVDVYAVGATLYQLLTGRIPHQDELERVRQEGMELDAFRRVLERRPSPIHEFARAAPAELVAIADKAMAPARHERYATMEWLASDLRAFLEVRPVSAYRTGAWVEAAKWIQRNRALAVALAVVALGSVGAAAGGFYLEGRRADALATGFDRERNLTGAVLLEAVLAQAGTLWPAPSQRMLQHAAAADGRRLIDSARDLDRRLADLVQAREREQDAVRVDDLGRQIRELERQRDGMGALPGALARIDAVGRAIEQRSLHRPAPEQIEERWRAALAALDRDPRFRGRGVVADPQLVPLAPVEPAGLWAFLHLDSADFGTPLDLDRPAEVTPERGLVLVLLPGGRVRLGARPPTSPEDIATAHADLHAHRRPNEQAPDRTAPVETDLAPYYVGRHEVTRGQWRLVMGEERGGCPVPAGIDAARLPADLISREDAAAFCARLGLTLPTEAQWESAYRAGTSTPFFVELPYGSVELPDQDDTPVDQRERDWTYDFRPLETHANVLDATGFDARIPDATREQMDPYLFGEPRDGWVFTAPVGSFAPNGHGLFDMAGNVFEWCRDDFVPHWGPLDAGEGLQIGPARDSNLGVLRGGSWFAAPWSARAAYRRDIQPNTRERDTGFRVARLATAG